jgi:uncharacterized protein (DUF983 family)
VFVKKTHRKKPSRFKTGRLYGGNRMKKECRNCTIRDECRDSGVGTFFFVIGIISAFAIRLVRIMNDVDELYGQISWYVGVLGFFVFFVYKFKVSHARRIRIEQQNLVEKFQQRAPLDEADYSLISALLCAIRSMQEQINYFFIFFLSALAIAWALYIDFFTGK